MYGLREAAKLWHDLLSEQVWKAKLKQLTSAPCRFYADNMLVTCYVNDLVDYGSTQLNLNHLKQKLNRKFVMKDLEEPKQFLGMELDWSINGQVHFVTGT